MRKILALLCIFGILCSSVVSHAQIITRSDMGISVYIDDNWVEMESSAGMSFQHKSSQDETILIVATDSNYGYEINQIDENTLRDICNKNYSDSFFAEKLAEINGASGMSVTTDSIVTGFETHNGINYYRFEKAYTARAFGFLDTPFYITVLLTVQNGKIYIFAYTRNYSDAQHYADMADMLDSISYDEGEIKIHVNGTRVYSDSAPMIVDDRTLVPIRAVAEAMGYSVSWDSEKGVAYLVSNDGEHMLAFAVGSNVALRDLNETITLDVPPVIHNSRTYLPLRAVAEAMNAKVNWVSESRIVDIWQ